MKANQAFRTRDEAVSPVIAVILMVAITVVLAATVYVWVSGFGAQSGTPAKTIALSSAGALTTTNTTDQVKQYTVASATSGMKYSDITLTVNGATLKNVNVNPAQQGASTWRVQSGGTYIVNNATSNPSNVVQAGDIVEIYFLSGGASGQSLRILDSQANSVILTLTVG